MRNFSLSENLLAQMAQGNGVGSAIVKGIDQGRARGQIRSDRRQASEQLALENKRADIESQRSSQLLKMKKEEFVMKQKEFQDEQNLAKRVEEREATLDQKGKDFKASYRNSALSDLEISALDAKVDAGDLEGAADELIKFQNFGKLTPQEKIEAERKATRFQQEQADRFVEEEKRLYEQSVENDKMDAVYDATFQNANLKIDQINDVLGQVFDEETGEFVDNKDADGNWVQGSENLITMENTGFLNKFFSGNILSQTSEGDLAAKLVSINSGLILTELTELKKTGATLGQITEKELEVLRTVDANIDQARHPDTLREELIKVRNAMVRIKQDLKDHPPLRAGVKPTSDGYHVGVRNTSSETPYEDEEANSIYNQIQGLGNG